ncbi:MAG: hypothetical protein ABWY71_02855 [Candidatus Saccharimonadales bacterium]
MTHEAGGEQAHFGPEHFNDATPETREIFDTAVEQLQQRFVDRATTRRHDYISGRVGNNFEHYVYIRCAIDEWHNPTKGSTKSNLTLAIAVQTAVGPPIGANTLDEGTAERLLNMQPPKKREFNSGEVYGGMTDDEYNRAVTYLSKTVPAEKWAWIKKARLLASDHYDAEFLPFAVTELLDTAPQLPPVCRGKGYFLNSLDFANGARFRVAWLEANPAYIRDLGAYETTRHVNIALPTGEEYFYSAFTNGTEQMLIQARNEAMRMTLAAQGLAVMDAADGGWAAITPEQRRMGVQAPSDKLMRRFNSLIQGALESGSAPF